MQVLRKFGRKNMYLEVRSLERLSKRLSITLEDFVAVVLLALLECEQYEP